MIQNKKSIIYITLHYITHYITYIIIFIKFDYQNSLKEKLQQQLFVKSLIVIEPYFIFIKTCNVMTF